MNELLRAPGRDGDRVGEARDAATARELALGIPSTFAGLAIVGC